MKLLAALLIVTNVYAVTFSRHISTPDGVSEQRFEINKDEIRYLKGSNYFDKQKTLTLGTFELKSKKVPTAELKNLEKILDKIETVDEFLKKKNSDFNDLTPSSHSPLILLDDFRIGQGSNFYSELLTIFERLQKLDWVQVSGIKLSKDYKTVFTIKDKKDSGKENFNFPFYCKKPQPPSVCTYKTLGNLYLD